MDLKRIFVFGSNLQGIHGAGAAKTAYLDYGARKGVGEGPEGLSYAIPTKLTPYVRLNLQEIEYYIQRFIKYAKEHPELQFEVTRVGCGLAGYTKEQIAPMFKDAPFNCYFHAEWRQLIRIC